MKNRTLAIFGIGTYALSIIASTSNSEGEPTMPEILVIISGIASVIFLILATVRLWRVSKFSSIFFAFSKVIYFVLEGVQVINSPTYGSPLILSTNLFKVISLIAFFWAVIVLWRTKQSIANLVPAFDPTNKLNAKSLLESGKTKFKAKDYHGAVNDFTKSIEIDEANPETYLERSKAKRELKDEKGANQDLRNGKLLLDKLDDGLKAYDEAGEYYDAEDYKNAIKHYNKAISLLPSLTDVYYNRGISKQLLEDLKGAMEDFSLSIELNASNKAEAYYQRSKIKSHKLNDKEGALQDLNMAIKTNPSEADFYYSRALLLDNNDALQDLNKAIELAPDDASIYFHRSLKRQAMQDYEGTIQDLTRYIELADNKGDFTISEAYSLRGGMRIFLNDFKGALQDADKAVEADPSNTNAIFERGTTKELLHDYEGAIIDFTRVIELNPSDGTAYYYRGSIKQRIGLKDEGVMDVIKAKSLGYNGT